MERPKHILVVDYNDDVRDVIVSLLAEHYRVGAAASGAAMRDFLETGDPVDCVTLDAVMPGETNASLLIHLKERGIPVVMISGSPDAMKYAADNGLQLLQKPFRAQELLRAVNAALASGEAGQRSKGEG